MQRADFVQDRFENSDEFASVRRVVDDLYDELVRDDIAELILDANKPGASSAAVQATFLRHAERLGFRSESKGLFVEYASALRPDYFAPVGDTGIILEVERGKSTINNMDLLDFWKCHICAHAHYLLLLVPESLVQNPTMKPRNEFAIVRKRLATFFEPANYTNVRALFLIGY